MYILESWKSWKSWNRLWCLTYMNRDKELHNMNTLKLYKGTFAIFSTLGQLQGSEDLVTFTILRFTFICCFAPSLLFFLLEFLSWFRHLIQDVRCSSVSLLHHLVMHDMVLIDARLLSHWEGKLFCLIFLSIAGMQDH